MSRFLSTSSKLAQAPSTRVRLLSNASTLSSSRNEILRYTRTRARSGPFLLVPTACISIPNGFLNGIARSYSTGPGGGQGGGGFPGFSLGQQHQKGDALKQYVRE